MNRADVRLADDRDRFVALVENSQEFIALARLDGTVLYVNAAGRRLVGLSVDCDVTATRMADYVPPDRVAEAAHHLRTTLKNGRWSGEFEYRHFQTDARLPVYCNAFALRETNGSVILAQVTRDLHDAKAAEAEQRAVQTSLAVRERQYRELADAIPQIVWSIASTESVNYYSRRWYEYTGLAPDPSPQAWLDVVHPDDFASASEKWSEVRRTGIPVSFDARLRSATGEYRWHLVAVQVVHDDIGQIAKLIGIATDIEDRRRAEARLLVLAEVSHRLSASLDLPVIVRTLLDALVPSNADCAFVNLANDDDGPPLSVAAYGADRVDWVSVNKCLSATVPRGIRRDATAALANQRAIVYGDVGSPVAVDALGAETAAILAGAGCRSVVVVPFVCNGVPSGALHVIRARWPLPFTEADALFFEELAQRAAIAITNARLYEHEVRVANTLQRASLPATLPSTDEVRFSGHYVPGESEALIGGDWYDAVRLADGRFLISIGDVAGSGLAAAAIMGNVRQIIRGVAQIVVDPKLMLDATDRALRDEHPDWFVTIFIAIYDPVSSTLTYASAGHPPAYLVTNHSVSILSMNALPVGLRDAEEPQPETIAVPDGSYLVVYTDGLIESTRNVLEGERLLVAELENGQVLEAREPARALIERLLPEGTRDDVAVLVARLPSGEAAQRRPTWAFDARDPEVTSRVREELLAEISAFQPDSDALSAAELVFGELIANVVRHTPGSAEVVLDLSLPYAVLHVIDRGRGFRRNDLLPDPMSESGFGLFLISAQSRHFDVIPHVRGGSHAIATLPIRCARGPIALQPGGPETSIR